MDMFTTDRSRSKSPAPQNSFQKELQAKMRERKRAGLGADLSDSAHGSDDDELGSDNEFLAQFSMTSKPKQSNKKPENTWGPPGSKKTPSAKTGSPYQNSRSPSPHSGKSSPYNGLFGKNKSLLDDDEDDDDDYADNEPSNLMMTMKKPWNPGATLNKKQTPEPSRRKSKALDALEEIQESKSPRFSSSKGKENKQWQPPSYNKPSRKSPLIQDEEEDEDVLDGRKIRPKSPNPRGRKQPSPILIDSLEEKEKPRPSPRFGKSTQKSKEETDESPRPKPRARQKGIFDDDFGTTPSAKPRSKTPTDTTEKKRSTTPKNELGGRKNPTGRKTPTGKDGRKTPTGKSDKDSSPEAGRKKSLLDFMADESDSKQKKKMGKERKLLASDSDSEDDSRSALKKKSSKSPVMFDIGRKSPSLRGGQRKSPLIAEEAEEVESRRGKLGIQKPSLRKSKAICDDDEESDQEMDMGIGGPKSAFQPVPKQRNKEREGRGKERVTPSGERDSSVCREVEEDPGPMRHASTMEAEEIKKKQPKQQTKEKQLLDNIIDKVESAQSSMQHIDPDKSQDKKEAQNKSARVPKYRPEPRYTKPTIPEPGSARTVDFNSTTDIREAVYTDWYAQKMERAKQELKEKKKKEKEEEDKKKKDQEEKLLEAKLSYQAWMEKKKEVLSARERKKKQTEEEKRAKEVEEKREKLKESEVTFRSWKENKDAVIREREHKKKQEEERKAREEEEKKREKQKDSKSAFDGWKSKKDVVILKKTVEIKKTEEEKEKAKLREQRKREREAQKAYDKWMARKEDFEHTDKRKMQQSQEHLAMTRPAWSPASRTIPAGR